MKKEEKKEKPEIKLNEQELRAVSNLLFTGKWNLSLQESQQVVRPIINKLVQMIDQLKK